MPIYSHSFPLTKVKQMANYSVDFFWELHVHRQLRYECGMKCMALTGLIQCEIGPRTYPIPVISLWLSFVCTVWLRALLMWMKSKIFDKPGGFARALHAKQCRNYVNSSLTLVSFAAKMNLSKHNTSHHTTEAKHLPSWMERLLHFSLRGPISFHALVSSVDKFIRFVTPSQMLEHLDRLRLIDYPIFFLALLRGNIISG